eukprot:COSAG05_NODE_2145_length_3481_cov_4.068007_3_plen_110_part_00
MEARVSLGLTTYYNTLLSRGITGYRREEMDKDFNIATWHATTIPCFAGKMLANVRLAADAAEKGSTAETEALDMIANLTKIFNNMAERTKKLVEIRDAYSDAPFSVPGH